MSVRSRVGPWVLLALVTSLALTSAAHAQALYWLDTNFAAPSLNKSDAAGNNQIFLLLPAQSLPEGLAGDASGNLYWTEAIANNARLQRVGFALTNPAVLATGNSVMRGIAVDATANKMYWTTSNLLIGSFVRRSALDGSGFTNLISLGATANPRGIAVDHAGGKIYWTDFDQNIIYRANLDGTAMEAWQTLTANVHPYGIAIDPVGQMVFWTEYAGSIIRAPIAGGARVKLRGGLPNPTYIALDPLNGVMYWSEGGAGQQHICKGVYVGSTKTVLSLPITTYGGLFFQANGNASGPPLDLPTEFALAPFSPNPARGAVRAEFALPQQSHVRLSVIDLQGREVAVLAEGDFPAGRHEAVWETNAGRPPAAGVYFVRMVAGGRGWTRRLVRVQ